MDNKDPWFSYDKVSTSSDAFAYVQDIGNDLSDSLEHLNQGSPVRAKGLPTEKYTAGNTNDVMEGVHEESFLTQTPSKISRRYSPLTKSEYSGYRPPDPVFLSYNNNQTTNTFLPEPLAKHKSIEDIERVSVNNKFTVNKLTSTTREAAIAPEALELINILNPVEAREIQNNSTSQDIRVEKYTSTVPPIEVKKVETKINNIVQKPDSIVISKPKTLTTYNQSNNKNEQNFESLTSVSNEIKEVNSEGPTFNSTVQNVNNTSVSSNIEVKKPVVTTKLSQYTSTIDFNSFVSSNFAEIVDQKTEQKIQSRNNINVKKLVTDVNYFIESNNREFKNNISNSVNDFFSTYSEQNLNTLQNNILEVINSNRNLNVLNQEVTNLVKEYFSKNNNEFNQSLVENFSDFFNITLQEKMIKIENTTQNELSIVQNIESLLSDIKNYYESKQEEISTIISEVNNENVLTKVVQLAETYQEYKSNTQSLLNNLSSYVSSSNISQIQNNFNSQVNNADYKSDTSINAFKQEVFGFVNLYLSNAVEQNVFNELLSNINNSSSSEEINSVVNSFVSANKTENNQQVFDSLQYFSNDKYSNLASSYLNETVENELLNSFSTVVQKYLSQNEIQNSIDIQVKNELAETFTSQINRTMQSFELTELKTSIENVYNSDNINQFKSDFSEVLNKSENKTNVKAISYLNDILEKNILQYTLKSSNVLNESRYSNSVKRLVNENLHNVVSNIVHNLSEVNTYSDNKNVSTLLNNIKIINDNLLLNNSESRLVNFNLIQKSIENFLVNTQNNYESKLSKIKLNETTISPEIVNNMSYFESLSSETNSVNLNEVRNIITSMNSENFNNDSKEFIEETKIYTDLINMKNQISSEINNFVSSTFETILETNKNSTLISSKQIINLIEDAVSTFNSSDISNNAISYIKNVLQDVRNPELYNSTFQLITSTNLVEDQIKNYLLENNSILADYSLQQIMNTINQPVYSDYVTFQEIKEIINNTQNSSSFGILSEIKKYINEINSDKNEEFISNLKTYLSNTETNVSNKNSFEFTENLKSFINEQNSYSPEFFNQIIESVSNKFENKSALVLNNIINENVSRFNQFVETLFSSKNSNSSTEEVLNTLSNFATSSYEISNAVNNYLSEETKSFKNENNEFINKLSSIINNKENISTSSLRTEIKNEIFNDFIQQILSSLSQQNINIQEINQITSSNVSYENKFENIKNFLSSIEQTSNDNKLIQNIKDYKIILNKENLKFEILDSVFNNSISNEASIENIIQKIITNKYGTLVFQNQYKNITTNIDEKSDIRNVNNLVENISSSDFEFLSNRNNFIENVLNSVTNLNSAEQNYLTQNLFNNSLLNFELKNESFMFDNEFKEAVSNIYNSSNQDNLEVKLNDFKQQILNTAINNTFVALESNNTEINSIENIIKNSSQSMDIKSELILNELNNAINSKSYSISETKNLETIRNYILNETFKIELINKFNENKSYSSQEFENFEKEVNIRLQKYIYTPSFISTINELRNNIVQSKNTQEVVKFYNEQKNVVLNDFKNITTNLLTAAYPEYLNTQSYSSLINAENIEDITNILSEYNSQSTSNQTSENNPITNIVLTNLFQQSSFISRLNEQVTNLIKNENVVNNSSITRLFDSFIFASIENKFNELNTMLMQNAVANISQSSISTSISAPESAQIITEIIKDNLKYQKDYVDQILNSFNISSVSKQIEIQNETIVKSLNTVVQNYNVAKVLTNTLNDNISINQNIVNNKVIENVSKILEENGNAYYNNESVNNSSESLTNNTSFSQQILNTLNQSSVMNLFDQDVINNIVTNSKEIRTLLTEKQNNVSIELNNQYLNQNENILESNYKSVNSNTSNQKIENIENKIEKIENITLDFENKTNYQRSSIEIFDEINNNTQIGIHPNFDQISLSENNTTIESINNNNEFKNITVVKQIEENEDLEISNFRIEKVWNKFVQEEVSKIVEEVNESNSSVNQQNIVNKNETLLNNSNNVENFNKSEYNYIEGDVNKTENLSVYNTINKNESTANSFNKEVEEKTNYKEITELVFTRIEEKLKTYNVTTEDIIILKHKILSEVTEIYEKRSQIDIRNSEEKMKKEMKDLFYRFLNS